MRSLMDTTELLSIRVVMCVQADQWCGHVRTPVSWQSCFAVWCFSDSLEGLLTCCVFAPAILGAHGKAPRLLQRFRFSTSVLFTAAVSLEYMTPLMPRYFLPLASLANVGKSVGLTTYIATQPVFLNSFIRHENLADINAKTQVRLNACNAPWPHKFPFRNAINALPSLPVPACVTA